MSSTTSVALAGATGNLGGPVLEALLDAGFQVTVLTRQGSTSASKLPKHDNQTIKEVDYSSLESITSALSGVNVVVSTMAIDALDDAKRLVDAALSAGVSRFIPSEFGSDLSNGTTAALPVYGSKIAIQKYLEEKSARNSTFTYTLFYNNSFFDWGLEMGFLLNPKEHTGTLYDGGDRPFSVTRLATIGAGIVGVINHLDITANKEVFIHDGVTTQNKIIAAKKQKDGQEWNVSVKSTDELLQESYAALEKGGDAIAGAMYGFIYVAIFKDGYGGDFTGKTWNEKLGVKVLSDEEFEKVQSEVV